MSTWRDIAAPIISRIIQAHPPGKERRKALREAYPFGERKYWPYKVWLDEIKRQEGRAKAMKKRREAAPPGTARLPGIN